MTDEIVINTEELQLESLVNFAAAIGYESVWSVEGRLMRFKAPKFRSVGEEYMSVKRAIKLHNTAGDDVWRHISTVNMDFNSFLNTNSGHDLIALLFAGSVKIVDTVKGQFKRGKGFFVSDQDGCHKVRFVTEKDYCQYKHYVGE